MADVLARIVARKREEVAARLGGIRPDAAPTDRSLKSALSRPGARFIMEMKRASPSGHRAVHDLPAAMRAYAPVADAISVLTDGADFGGSLDDLSAVRAAFDGPILAKDFVVHPAQVAEARAAGADAVLAMMSVLTDDEAAEVLVEARRLSMDVIVEVHDEAELARALRLDAAIIGINNRDLKSLTTDLAVTERLAPLVPADRLVIAESGIATRADVERLAPHADAFLVGSSLMAAPDIAEAARTLVHGRVKLCGLTRAEDVAMAAALGATHAGFILVPGTPRAISLEKARSLVPTASAHGLKTVGVFRDETPDAVAHAADTLGLNVVQLHGTEEVAPYRERLGEGIEIWAACPVEAQAASARAGATRTLFDRSGGGTGRPFDWSLLAGRTDLPAAFIAGGIGPANAAEASRLGAHGLDVGSAIEATPGTKDPAKAKALFAALRPTSRGDAR